MKLPGKAMKSTYKIIWTDEAFQNLQNIINFLEKFWTEKEISKFVRLLDKQLMLIKQNPALYPFSQKSKNIRKSVLTKQITLYYRVDKADIHLITLFDNRQNPDKLKL